MNKFIVAVTLGITLVAQSSVLGHAKVKANNPAIGETVSEGQNSLQINFNKKVRVTSFKLYELQSTQKPDSKELDLTENRQITLTGPLTKSFAKKLLVSFENLSKGSYLYQWISVARDGHTQKGSGHFYVAD